MLKYNCELLYSKYISEARLQQKPLIFFPNRSSFLILKKTTTTWSCCLNPDWSCWRLMSEWVVLLSCDHRTTGPCRVNYSSEEWLTGSCRMGNLPLQGLTQAVLSLWLLKIRKMTNINVEFDNKRSGFQTLSSDTRGCSSLPCSGAFWLNAQMQLGS